MTSGDPQGSAVIPSWLPFWLLSSCLLFSCPFLNVLSPKWWLLCMFIFLLRAAGHHVENVTAVVWKELRWDFHMAVFFLLFSHILTHSYFAVDANNFVRWRRALKQSTFWLSGTDGLGGKAVFGAQSRSREQDGNKDQFELEHVRAHSWGGLSASRDAQVMSQARTVREPLSCRPSSRNVNHCPQTWGVLINYL